MNECSVREVIDYWRLRVMKWRAGRESDVCVHPFSQAVLRKAPCQLTNVLTGSAITFCIHTTKLPLCLYLAWELSCSELCLAPSTEAPHANNTHVWVSLAAFAFPIGICPTFAIMVVINPTDPLDTAVL